MVMKIVGRQLEFRGVRAIVLQAQRETGATTSQLRAAIGRYGPAILRNEAALRLALSASLPPTHPLLTRPELTSSWIPNVDLRATVHSLADERMRFGSCPAAPPAPNGNMSTILRLIDLLVRGRHVLLRAPVQNGKSTIYRALQDNLSIPVLTLNLGSLSSYYTENQEPRFSCTDRVLATLSDEERAKRYHSFYQSFIDDVLERYLNGPAKAPTVMEQIVATASSTGQPLLLAWDQLLGSEGKKMILCIDSLWVLTQSCRQLQSDLLQQIKKLQNIRTVTSVHISPVFEDPLPEPLFGGFEVLHLPPFITSRDARFFLRTTLAPHDLEPSRAFCDAVYSVSGGRLAEIGFILSEIFLLNSYESPSSKSALLTPALVDEVLQEYRRKIPILDPRHDRQIVSFPHIVSSLTAEEKGVLQKILENESLGDNAHVSHLRRIGWLDYDERKEEFLIRGGFLRAFLEKYFSVFPQEIPQ